MCQKSFNSFSEGANMRIKRIQRSIGEAEVFVVNKKWNAETGCQSWSPTGVWERTGGKHTF